MESSNVLERLAGEALEAASRATRPTVEGRLAVPGLWAAVEVLRDGRGVPHIYAENAHDLYFAQGFVHAQERLWQMDYYRRVGTGRLSEVLGEAALAADRWLRTLRLRPAAEADAARLRGGARGAVAAYAAGVNACIAAGPIPIEFRLLGYKPEPWTAADTLTWQKTMSWFLSGNWESELLRARLIERLGPEEAAGLEPPRPASWPTIMPPSAEACATTRPRPVGGGRTLQVGRAGEDALRSNAEARAALGTLAGEGLGSNCWAVHGSRTTTGAPILANDMHLILSAPAIWFENHLEGGGLRVSGVTFPGVPGVVAGHNGRVAWGFTNGYVDVQDLYLEHLRTLDDGGVQYEAAGAWHDALVEEHTVRVRGHGSHAHRVVVTRHGPIVSDLAPGLAEEAVALRWTAHEPEETVQALWRLSRARTIEEARRSLGSWGSPVQNVVLADADGNIGYTLAGRVPVRRSGDGSVPVPGWTDEYEWEGYVPFDDLPHLTNPEAGFIVTANNQVAGDGYPYNLGVEVCQGNRAERITELLSAGAPVSVAYTRAMQYDQVSTAARRMARHILAAAAAHEELADLVAPLEGWDGTLAADSRAAAVYEVFVQRAIATLLDRTLGDRGMDEDLAARYAGVGPNQFLAARSSMGESAIGWLEYVLEHPEARWGAEADGSDPAAARDEAIRAALAETREHLAHALGEDPARWTWGRLHRVLFRHPLGAIPALSAALNRGPYEIGGDAHTIWASGPSHGGALNASDLVGPPYRMIVSLANVADSVSQLAPGQSGRPDDPHYDDQIGAWFAGEYYPMLFEREAVEAAAEARLTLAPR